MGLLVFENKRRSHDLVIFLVDGDVCCPGLYQGRAVFIDPGLFAEWLGEEGDGWCRAKPCSYLWGFDGAQLSLWVMSLCPAS